MSKSKKKYVIERRIPPGTYSSWAESVAPMLFVWSRHPLHALPDYYGTKKKAQQALSTITGSWGNWEFRVSPASDG